MEATVLNINLDLSAPSLREIANHYELLARVCRARAAELDRYAETKRRTQRLFDNLANTPAVLDAYLEKGLDFNAALKAAEADTGIQAESRPRYPRDRPIPPGRLQQEIPHQPGRLLRPDQYGP